MDEHDYALRVPEEDYMDILEDEDWSKRILFKPHLDEVIFLDTSKWLIKTEKSTKYFPIKGSYNRGFNFHNKYIKPFLEVGVKLIPISIES